MYLYIVYVYTGLYIKCVPKIYEFTKCHVLNIFASDKVKLKIAKCPALTVSATFALFN